MYRYGIAFHSQWIKTEGTFGKRVAAEGCGDPFHREGQRSGRVGGEGSESKGWKSAGRTYHAVFVGQGKGMHVYLGEKPKEEKDKRKEDELVAVAKEVFSRKRFVTYVELVEEIQSILEVKERTAKSYIKFMREKEIILKSSDNQSYYVTGNF